MKELFAAGWILGSFFLGSIPFAYAVVRWRKLDPAGVGCAFNADPLGALMSEGHLLVPLDLALTQMARTGIKRSFFIARP